MQITLEEQPCALQFVDDSLVVGTYALEEADQTRRGSLLLLSPRLELLHRQACAGVLDVKVEGARVYVGLSSGCISVHDTCPQLLRLEEHRVSQAIVLCVQPRGERVVAFSCSDGRVGILRDGAVVWEAQAHSLEAWTCGFDAHAALVSGGDDGLLCVDGARLQRHDCGVTSILSAGEGVLLVGSYDGWLRAMQGRKVVEQVRLPGGVWRLVPMPDGILACCMQGGAALLSPSGHIRQLLTATEVGELVYGGASRPGAYAVCSFYDRRLTLTHHD